ncbi:hypothetical protein [Burkholderia contaminans]|nr:hypothetical protein [Burkholderia contaminans]WFN11542.1 hypothetical protein LXE92_03660 [Burkholderia contaminans]
MNRNVDILNSQMALRAAQTSITSSQTLTVTDHVGRRVGINFGSPGWVKLPAAKKCAADQVIHLRNVGLTSVTLAVEDGSGDYIGLDVLQPFESVLMDTNGSTGWWVLFRGRSSSADEAVYGRLKVGSDLVVAGEIKAAFSNAFRATQGEYGAILRNDGTDVYFLQTKKGDPNGGWNNFRPFSWSLYDGYVKIDAPGTGCYIGSRPTWKGGLVPWDNGNLPDPLRASDVQAIGATGGDEGDLSNAFQVRLAAGFRAGAKSVTASASLFICIGAGAATANDFLCYLDVVDIAAGAVVASGAVNVFSVPNGQQYAGLASAGSLSCNVAANSLTVGKQYQVRLFVRKNVLYGPIYPKGMSITGMVA